MKSTIGRIKASRAVRRQGAQRKNNHNNKDETILRKIKQTLISHILPSEQNVAAHAAHILASVQTLKKTSQNARPTTINFSFATGTIGLVRQREARGVLCCLHTTRKSCRKADTARRADDGSRGTIVRLTARIKNWTCCNYFHGTRSRLTGLQNSPPQTQQGASPRNTAVCAYNRPARRYRV